MFILRLGDEVGPVVGVELGNCVGRLVGRNVLRTPLINGADVEGNEVVGIADGIEDGWIVG